LRGVAVGGTWPRDVIVIGNAGPISAPYWAVSAREDHTRWGRQAALMSQLQKLSRLRPADVEAARRPPVFATAAGERYNFYT